MMALVCASNGRTVRWALAATRGGDVYWRQDAFAPADDPIQPLRWISHQGPLTVAAVIEAVPHCQETIAGRGHDGCSSAGPSAR
jgi:hypothetical protein